MYWNQVLKNAREERKKLLLWVHYGYVLKYIQDTSIIKEKLDVFYVFTYIHDTFNIFIPYTSGLPGIITIFLAWV